MRKVEEASEILSSLGLPKGQRNERSALTLLALADIGKKGSWKNAKQPLRRVWDIMRFMRERYGKNYAANSRETIRRQTVHQFEQARIVDRNPDDPKRPTNSGDTVYALTADVLEVLKVHGTPDFNSALETFLRRHGSLQQAYDSSRDSVRVPLKMPGGETVFLSPGKHNELQRGVVQDFGPRFAPGAEVLFIGDTARKHVICETKKLARLGVVITEHDKLPDIVIYLRDRNWIFLIEAVTTHGPVSPKRHHEIESFLGNCTADRIYVTAFLNMNDFRKYAADIAWETEVWVAAKPDHMIHFNGPKFLEPYRRASNQISA